MRNEESNGPVASEIITNKEHNLKINGQPSPRKVTAQNFSINDDDMTKITTTPKKNGVESTPEKSSVVTPNPSPEKLKTPNRPTSPEKLKTPNTTVATPIVAEKTEGAITDDDAKLRQSIAELNSANVSASCETDSTSEKPRKLNTFFGGVRFFASLTSDEVALSDSEPSPFEPSKPRFHTVRRGRRSIYETDTGERPFALFGDVEDKINTSGEDDSDAYDPSNITNNTIGDHLNMDPVVSLEKLDKSFEATLSKPANWANINRLVINPNAKKPRTRKTKEIVTPNDSSQESTPRGNNLSSDNVIESRLRRTRGKRTKFSEQINDQFEYAFGDDDDDEEEAEMEPKRKRRRRKRRPSEEEDFVPSAASSRFEKVPVYPKQLQQPQRVHTIWPRRPVIPPRQRVGQKNTGNDAYQEPQEIEQKSSSAAPTPQPAKPKFMETVLVIKPYHQQEKIHINRTMFANMRFVLTSATRPKTDANQSEEEGNPPILPFNKRQIRQLIEERSGTVYEDFTHLVDVSNCFLIADTHYRTHKYLSALVRAVPCILHTWIFECVKENRLLPYAEFLLPAGRSLETNQIIPWHDKCLTLLNGIKMFVHTENKPTIPAALDFTQIWTPIARSMGAIMVDTLSDSIDDPEARFDIFLTDSSCPEDIIAKAKALSATPVSSEWLIQAILTGVLPSTSGHQKYQHDFVEPPANPVVTPSNPNPVEPTSKPMETMPNPSEATTQPMELTSNPNESQNPIAS